MHVAAHDGGLCVARARQSRAALEVLPGRAPADDGAHPGAPAIRTAPRSCSSSCPTRCGPTCCCAWRASARFRRTSSRASPSVIEQRAARPRRPEPRAARRRARRRGALQLPGSPRQPARARAPRGASRRTRRRPIRNLMFVFDDLVNIEETGIREIVNARRQEDADHRAQGRERSDPAALLQRTCPSAPSI